MNRSVPHTAVHCCALPHIAFHCLSLPLTASHCLSHCLSLPLTLPCTASHCLSLPLTLPFNTTHCCSLPLAVLSLPFHCDSADQLTDAQHEGRHRWRAVRTKPGSLDLLRSTALCCSRALYCSLLLSGAFGLVAADTVTLPAAPATSQTSTEEMIQPCLIHPHCHLFGCSYVANQHIAYLDCMLTDVPNFVFVTGYFQVSLCTRVE